MLHSISMQQKSAVILAENLKKVTETSIMSTC
ncbi:Uncharacterised protein [Salmonella enterica subsp. enterica serovar Typhi]|nr:Uncharacterised protein [Salmonella enterica subsp. enterica serovar Typhi]CID06209.1 Uncharacterised protein [Salmonella enterica subsp. enterica serovar Enteritidis]VTP21114.1 Uncharacterised protein [Salmonella enterica subsp. enterica serovar Typhi str. Ty2]CEQ54898.1 Uncharacterised protein [Salmonella enterica subsp. enterica serovar Typhi]CEQ55767.1 Uncharacterised protein [Salmonella enterica subsp. enterica serovar Typhi]